MPCNRGQANPDRQTTLRLFSDSGGFCQRLGCPNKLFVDTGSKNVHIAEMAHIIAASAGGPRSNVKLTGKERGTYDNLILLCANCHTTIDKAPKDFPESVIVGWKAKHVERIAELFGAVKYQDRGKVRDAIEPSLIENRTIFEKFGPDNSYRYDPESELAMVWQRKMKSIILPNNKKILAILDSNRDHLNEKEITVLETFRQHVDDLIAKHIGEEEKGVAGRFPTGMKDILLETRNV